MLPDPVEALVDVCTAKGLSARQSRFVAVYVIRRNAFAAYREAYDVSPNVKRGTIEQEVNKLLHHHPRVSPVIRELRTQVEPQVIERAIEVVGITRASVMGELAKVGFANIANYGYIDDDGNFIIDLTGCTREQLAAITEVKTEVTVLANGTEKRRTWIKLHGKRQALVDIGKELGMFVDRNAVDVNIVPPDVQRRREKNRARLFAMLKRMELGWGVRAADGPLIDEGLDDPEPAQITNGQVDGHDK
jgi:phage terminase small subunit